MPQESPVTTNPHFRVLQSEHRAEPAPGRVRVNAIWALYLRDLLSLLQVLGDPGMLRQSQNPRLPLVPGAAACAPPGPWSPSWSLEHISALG